MEQIALWATPGITMLLFGLLWRYVKSVEKEVGGKFMRRDVCAEIQSRHESERKELKEDVTEIKLDVKELLRINGGRR